MSEPNVVQRPPEQLEEDLKAPERRDLQLWGSGACLLLAVAAGLVLLLAPPRIGKFSDSVHSSNLPAYTWGLLGLLVLLNAQTLYERFRLRRARRQLVQRLRLAERAAQVDPLTGVFNRRYMEIALAKEVSRAERYHTHLSLAVIDVDKFKEFNTRFGHLEGDRVITAVASLLCKNFRAADTVVRYGGDEFIVVMPETDAYEATLAIKRLQRHYLAQWNRTHSDCGYAITVTYGVTEFKPGMTVTELIHEAERRLLDAKLDEMPKEAAVVQ